jgi:hypothetical protein
MGQDDGARRGASEFHVLENSHGRRHRAREGWNSRFFYFFIFKDLQKYTFISKFCKNYTYTAVWTARSLPTIVSSGGRELPPFETVVRYG